MTTIGSWLMFLLMKSLMSLLITKKVILALMMSAMRRRNHHKAKILKNILKQSSLVLILWALGIEAALYLTSAVHLQQTQGTWGIVQPIKGQTLTYLEHQANCEPVLQHWQTLFERCKDQRKNMFIIMQKHMSWHLPFTILEINLILFNKPN